MCLGRSPRVFLPFALKRLVGEESWIQTVEAKCSALTVGIYWKAIR